MPAPESPGQYLPNDSSRGEFADSLPDTNPYFEAWLDSLRPATKTVDNPAILQLKFAGALRVDCCVLGVVHSPTGTLTISETGEVHGDIFVATAIIDGLVRGDISATQRVELGSHARVMGNIETPALSIQPGAVFEGQSHFLPPLAKNEGKQIASVGDSKSAKGSSRKTRSKRDQQEEETEGMVLAAGR